MGSEVTLYRVYSSWSHGALVIGRIDGVMTENQVRVVKCEPERAADFRRVLRRDRLGSSGYFDTKAAAVEFAIAKKERDEMAMVDGLKKVRADIEALKRARRELDA